MSHNNNIPSNFFKFEGTGLDTYTVVHNLNDIRPVVSIYHGVSGASLTNSPTTIWTVINNNTIQIEFGDITPIRGEVIGFPEPGE